MSRRALIQLRDPADAKRASVRRWLEGGRAVDGVPGLWRVSIAEGDWARAGAEGQAFELHPDPQLKPFAGWFDKMRAIRTQAPPADKGLTQVLERIGAPEAWKKSRGEGTFVAIVDTGVSALLADLPKEKRAGGWSADGRDPWTDELGHGSMCACVAAGNLDQGGRFNGVAPDAKLYSCKVSVNKQDFYSSDVIEAYSWLIARRKEHGRPVIVNNSFGFETCAPPKVDESEIRQDHPLTRRLREAIDAGLTMVFAAGNSHGLCGGGEGDHEPNTIWAWNSLPTVLCVGNVNEKDEPWLTSSRGPGQWAGADGETKPDCCAPTYGEVAWGDGYREIRNGWGTSGAAPQAAGLAALLAAQRPAETPAQRIDRICSTCDGLTVSHLIVGAGVINCGRAVY